MNSINATNSIANQTALPADGSSQPLTSLANKISISGDIASECMALMSEDSNCQYKINKQEIEIKQRHIKEIRKRCLELIEKKRAAQKKSGFFSLIGSVIAGVCVAASTIATIASGGSAAGLLVASAYALAGASLSGQCKLVATDLENMASNADIGVILADNQRKELTENKEELMQALQVLSEVETKMHTRIRDLADKESVGQYYTA
jgi:hypothetical protein